MLADMFFKCEYFLLFTKKILFSPLVLLIILCFFQLRPVGGLKGATLSLWLGLITVVKKIKTVKHKIFNYLFGYVTQCTICTFCFYDLLSGPLVLTI